MSSCSPTHTRPHRHSKVSHVTFPGQPLEKQTQPVFPLRLLEAMGRQKRPRSHNIESYALAISPLIHTCCSLVPVMCEIDRPAGAACATLIVQSFRPSSAKWTTGCCCCCSCCCCSRCTRCTRCNCSMQLVNRVSILSRVHELPTPRPTKGSDILVQRTNGSAVSQ